MTLNELQDKLKELVNNFGVSGDTDIYITKGDVHFNTKSVHALFTNGKVVVNLDLVEKPEEC